MISALVFACTGYGWSSFNELQKGLSTADVIGFNSPDGATDILLVGSDRRTDANGNPLPADALAGLNAGDDDGHDGELTDTMILVRIPNDGTRASAISLPRDLYVRMPGGFGQHRLNSAYSRGKNHTATELVEQGAEPGTAHQQSVREGRKLLVQTVEGLAGVSIDHYAEINLLGFSLLTEAVGGVEVCLKEPVRDRFSGADFDAGRQTISGPEALAFVRQRHGLPRGDLDRVVRQQVFLASLANRVLSAGTLTNPNRIRDLIDATQQSLVLDENLDVLDFASRLQNLAAGNVEFMTVPVAGDVETESEGAVLEVDPQEVREFVAATIGPNTSPPRRAPDSGSTSAVAVDVLNASGVTGLAATVSERLTNQGFAEGAVGNADTRRVSLVRYPTGEYEAALGVSEALNDLPVEEDPNLEAGVVQVYLGKDYSGPGVGSTGGPVGHSGTESADEPVRAMIGPHARPMTTQQPPPPQPPTPPLVASDVPCVD